MLKAVCNDVLKNGRMEKWLSRGPKVSLGLSTERLTAGLREGLKEGLQDD